MPDVLPLTWFGFRRKGVFDRGEGAPPPRTLLAPGRWVTGDALVRTVAAHGDLVYGFVDMGASGVAGDRFWLVTLELVDVKQAPRTDARRGDPSCGVGGLGSGIEARFGTSWECVGPPHERTLRPIHATKLGTPGEDAVQEFPVIEVAEDGKYIAVTYDNGGFWLLDSSDARRPKVVAGLWKENDVAGWFGWDSGTFSIDRGLGNPVTESARSGVARYPAWPIPPAGTPDGPVFRESIQNPSISAELFGEGDARFMLLNTYPFTVWKISEQGGSFDDLLFVGAFCGTWGRTRIAAATEEHVYLMGEEGAWAVPLCETATDPGEYGCCPP